MCVALYLISHGEGGGGDLMHSYLQLDNIHDVISLTSPSSQITHNLCMYVY